MYVRNAMKSDYQAVSDILQTGSSYLLEEGDISCIFRDYKTLVVTDDFGIKGALMFEYCNKGEADCFHILDIAVLPALRHQYIGTRLVQSLITQMKEQRRKKISVLVPSDNNVALNFFTARRFKETQKVCACGLQSMGHNVMEYVDPIKRILRNRIKKYID